MGIAKHWVHLLEREAEHWRKCVEKEQTEYEALEIDLAISGQRLKELTQSVAREERALGTLENMSRQVREEFLKSEKEKENLIKTSPKTLSKKLLAHLYDAPVEKTAEAGYRPSWSICELFTRLGVSLGKYPVEVVERGREK